MPIQNTQLETTRRRNSSSGTVGGVDPFLDKIPLQPATLSVSLEWPTVDISEMTRLMAKGDEAAYRAFYGAYYGRLWRYLLVVTHGNEEGSREALQGVLVRVVRHIKVFPSEDVFWSWLSVLARSALSDGSRKKRRYIAFLDRFTAYSRIDNDRAGSPRDESQLAELLEKNLKGLVPAEREMIERKYFDRHSVRMIAEQNGTTEKAVESALARIRRKLKEAVLLALRNE
jgi:RNA polymerase sigma factor (sigma-70 family)